MRYFILPIVAILLVTVAACGGHPALTDHAAADEGLYVLLNTDPNLYASLFDFVEPWKIDLLAYLDENYAEDLSLQDIARNTGRSLATLKRDFKKCSELSPQRWIIQRRLEAAHQLIAMEGHSVSDACYRVGFKNLSHFSRIYKDKYGHAPSSN